MKRREFITLLGGEDGQRPPFTARIERERRGQECFGGHS